MQAPPRARGRVFRELGVIAVRISFITFYFVKPKESQHSSATGQTHGTAALPCWWMKATRRLPAARAGGSDSGSRGNNPVLSFCDWLRTYSLISWCCTKSRGKMLDYYCATAITQTRPASLHTTQQHRPGGTSACIICRSTMRYEYMHFQYCGRLHSDTRHLQYVIPVDIV